MSRSASELPATSVYLWGNERREVNYLARVLGLRLDPQFRWVETKDSPTPPPASPGKDQAFRPARLMVPTHEVRPELLWSYLRPDRSRRYRFDVNEFLRLPEAIQVAVAALLSRETPRLLVVANVDLLDEFDPSGSGFYAEFIAWLNGHDITLMVTSTGEPLLEQIDFEYSVAASPKVGLRTALGICQWGDCSTCIFRECIAANELACGAPERPGGPNRPASPGLSASY